MSDSGHKLRFGSIHEFFVTSFVSLHVHTLAQIDAGMTLASSSGLMDWDRTSSAASLIFGSDGSVKYNGSGPVSVCHLMFVYLWRFGCEYSSSIMQAVQSNQPLSSPDDIAYFEVVIVSTGMRGYGSSVMHS
jgi:hypothetical protein